MKVALLGLYNRAVTEPGFHWDGQVKACRKLGIDYLRLDVHRYRKEQELSDILVAYDPDIILIEHKLGLKRWCSIKKKQVLKNVISVFWMCDGRQVEGVSSKYFNKIKDPVMEAEDLNNLVDYVFLANACQIQEYKQGFNIENVFFLPQAAGSDIMHRYDEEEIYDMLFAGSTRETWVHTGRRAAIDNLNTICDVKVIEDDKINTPILYSQSKLALSLCNFNYHLAVSNRFFIGLNCGACMMYQYFSGIELLVKNHVHIAWWKTVDELKNNILYYLNNPEERNEIRKNAEELGHSKHTYTHRLQNMFDIIENKTDEFYGFL